MDSSSTASSMPNHGAIKSESGAPAPVPQWGGYYDPYGMSMDSAHNPKWMPQHTEPHLHTPRAPSEFLRSTYMSAHDQTSTLRPLGVPMPLGVPPDAQLPHTTPSPHMTPSICSNTSTTPTTPSSTIPLNGRPLLNPNASAFTSKHIIIKSESGQEVDLERFRVKAKKPPRGPYWPSALSEPAWPPVSVRIESEDARQKRMAEEQRLTCKMAEEGTRKDEEEKATTEASAATKRLDLDLSSTRSDNLSAPLPSALATARNIEDLGSIEYPEGILSPKPELNKNAKPGEFRYDRDFLLQFMAVCKEKPDSLPPLSAIGLEPKDRSLAMPPRGDSQHGHNRRPSSSAMPPPSSNVSRQASVGLGISGFQKNVNPFTMGQFSTPKMSSEERFAASSRSTSVSNSPPGLPFGRPAPVVRSPSQGGPSSSGRTRSQRGGKRDKERPDPGPTRQGNAFGSSLANSMSLEPVAPPEVVDHKVRSLLNELTMERFDSISDQTIAWVNKSQNEKDVQTLLQFIQVVFEKATADEAWSKICARLCRKMMEQISPNIRDDGIKNADGKPIAGGQLFRKYLLNRCQDDFERGWVAKEVTAAAAATKATEDQAAKAAAEGEEDEENALYSEEYYAAQKAKRQGLGLIKFIGELFKLQMLTERIIHECVKKLLGNVENPVEEEIESLCKLLTTVGQILDTPKVRVHMHVYFSRMKELCKSPNVNSRMQFMLQDVIELRERKWIPRNLAAAPTTIAALREQIEREKAASDKDAMNRALSMSRGGLRRGGDCNDHQQIGPDDWAVAGGPAPLQPPKVNTRVQLMLQDVIESRERRWVPHDPIVTASDEPTIATLYEQMNKMRAMREQNLSNRCTRTLNVSRGLHQQIGLDGRAVGDGPAPRQPPKAGDLSNFGKINKSTPMTFGYSSVSQKDKTKSRESTLSRQGSIDMFSMLSAEVNPEIAAEVMSAKSSCPPSRKSSVDLGPGGAPEATPQRKRLQLLPRSVPVDSKSESTPASSAAGSDDEGAESTGGPSMSVEEANTRIAEDLKEFFSIRDLNEADVYFTKLPAEHRHLLVNKLVTRAVESKEANAQLVADLLDRAHSKNLVSPASFEEGFNPVAEIIDDIAIDAPKALSLFAIMMKGAHLHEDEERRARLTGKSMDSDKLVSLLSS